jgi:hypothetical protein
MPFQAKLVLCRFVNQIFSVSVTMYADDTAQDASDKSVDVNESILNCEPNGCLETNLV